MLPLRNALCATRAVYSGKSGKGMGCNDMASLSRSRVVRAPRERLPSPIPFASSVKQPNPHYVISQQYRFSTGRSLFAKGLQTVRRMPCTPVRTRTKQHKACLHAEVSRVSGRALLWYNLAIVGESTDHGLEETNLHDRSRMSLFRVFRSRYPG